MRPAAHPTPEQVRAFEGLCRERGFRLTHQRRVILEALLARHDHPPADLLYEDVRSRLPSVSRTTVYRVLEMLVRIGAARTVCHPGCTVRYDARTGRHHHLVCLGCGRIEDVEVPELDDLPVRGAVPRGFEVRDYSVQIQGTCANCRREETRARGRKGKRTFL